MKIRIYQLKEEHRDLLFMNYNKERFNLDNYNVVYEYDNNEEDYEVNLSNLNVVCSLYLEPIYDRFNINRPSDFKGHSLSVSDLVRLNEKLYYCDSVGWKEIDNSMTEEEFKELMESEGAIECFEELPFLECSVDTNVDLK